MDTAAARTRYTSDPTSMLNILYELNAPYEIATHPVSCPKTDSPFPVPKSKRRSPSHCPKQGCTVVTSCCVRRNNLGHSQNQGPDSHSRSALLRASVLSPLPDTKKTGRERKIITFRPLPVCSPERNVTRFRPSGFPEPQDRPARPCPTESSDGRPSWMRAEETLRQAAGPPIPAEGPVGPFDPLWQPPPPLPGNPPVNCATRPGAAH